MPGEPIVQLRGTPSGADAVGVSDGDARISRTGPDGINLYAAPSGADQIKLSVPIPQPAKLTMLLAPTDGGGAPSGAAGGDLGGTYPNPIVRRLHPRDQQMAYDQDGQLLSVQDIYGTKTFSYDAQGRLQQLTGSGLYASKSFTYDTDSNLTEIVVN